MGSRCDPPRFSSYLPSKTRTMLLAMDRAGLVTKPIVARDGGILKRGCRCFDGAIWGAAPIDEAAVGADDGTVTDGEGSRAREVA